MSMTCCTSPLTLWNKFLPKCRIILLLLRTRYMTRFILILLLSLSLPSCSKRCHFKCIQEGIGIKLNENIGIIEVCSTPFCYKVNQPKSPEIVQFPRDVVLNQHLFQIKAWSNGYQMKNMEIECPSSPFCEMVDCYFCWELIGNPQCAPKAV